MKTIKVKVLVEGCEPAIIDKGEWIDLKAAEDITLSAPWAGLLNRQEKDKRKVTFENHLIPLGVAMELPKGYEAVVNSRSSTYKNFGVFLANGQGVIDNIYRGDNDQWFANMIALRDTTIHKGDRICQFRIQLSQKATFWQKLKYLFSSGVEIKIVNTLGNPDRSGHGSTGIH